MLRRSQTNRGQEILSPLLPNGLRYSIRARRHSRRRTYSDLDDTPFPGRTFDHRSELEAPNWQCRAETGSCDTRGRIAASRQTYFAAGSDTKRYPTPRTVSRCLGVEGWSSI